MSYKWILCSATLAVGTAAHAGTVIDTNLPAGTQIVNIDGRNDGAAAYGPNQDAWYQPFAVNGNLLSVTLDPGTYTFSLIDPTDAAAQFSGLDAGQLSQIYTAWTYNSPYVTDWMAFRDTALTDHSEQQLISGAVGSQVANPETTAGYWPGLGWHTAQNAYDAAVSSGVYNQIWTGSGRVTGVQQSDYTFDKTTTLIFIAPDNVLGDNVAGVSVVVHNTAAVPEPSSLLVMCPGLLLLARKRRK